MPETNVPEGITADLPESDGVLDLSGVPCPQNSAEALLELEFMDQGEVLELIIDDGEPIANVPESLTIEGHAILRQERSGEQWRLWVRRAEEA